MNQLDAIDGKEDELQQKHITFSQFLKESFVGLQDEDNTLCY